MSVYGRLRRHRPAPDRRDRVGQGATGFIAVGQLARGVIVLGQLAIGVVALGQLAVGAVWAGGMVAVAPVGGPYMLGTGLLGRLPFGALRRGRWSQFVARQRRPWVSAFGSSCSSGSRSGCG